MHGRARGHILSDVAIARFWQIVCYVCIGGSCFFPSSGAIPSEPAVPCPGSWASRCVCGVVVRGLSAGNLLQGPQGCLHGHIHSVADGFRVVWHCVTSALEGRGRRLYLFSKNSSRCYRQAWGRFSPRVGPPGALLLLHWFAILRYEDEKAPLPPEFSPLLT